MRTRGNTKAARTITNEARRRKSEATEGQTAQTLSLMKVSPRYSRPRSHTLDHLKVEAMVATFARRTRTRRGRCIHDRPRLKRDAAAGRLPMDTRGDRPARMAPHRELRHRGDGAETSTLLLDQLPPLAGESVSLAEWVEHASALREMISTASDAPCLAGATLTRWERFTLLKM